MICRFFFSAAIFVFVFYFFFLIFVDFLVFLHYYLVFLFLLFKSALLVSLLFCCYLRFDSPFSYLFLPFGLSHSCFSTFFVYFLVLLLYYLVFVFLPFPFALLVSPLFCCYLRFDSPFSYFIFTVWLFPFLFVYFPWPYFYCPRFDTSYPCFLILTFGLSRSYFRHIILVYILSLTCGLPLPCFSIFSGFTLFSLVTGLSLIFFNRLSISSMLLYFLWFHFLIMIPSAL